MKNKRITYENLIISLVLIIFNGGLVALEASSGGQKGYDHQLEATEPNEVNSSAGLAGNYPMDISRYLLAENQGVQNARISPNGEKIAFLSSITGERQIWLTDVNGKQSKQLTFGNGITFYRWFPNGEGLLYGADNDGNELEAYYFVSTDGTKEKLVVDVAKNGYRRFGDFIDDDRIVFSSTERNGLDFDIYSYSIENKIKKRLYQGKHGVFAQSVSYNGKWLVLSETVGEDSNNLYLLDIGSLKLKTISKPNRRANHTRGGLHWTKDNKGFYLSSNLNDNFSSLRYFSLKNGFQAIEKAKGDIENVQLCFDDRYLVWSVNDGGFSRLKVKDLATGKDLATPVLPDGVLSLHCNNSTTIAIRINSWNNPGSIFSWDFSSSEKPIFTASLAGLDPARLVKPTSITLPARDGVQLQGLLYLPNTLSTTAPPVVFKVHGGPTGQSRPYFSGTTQYLLDKGIAVFYPNVRGSTGFGHTYAALDDKKNRLNSIRDLVDMLTYVGKEGLVDSKKAVVTGGSYGGFAVNAVLANYPGNFVAGASLFGVADWVTALQIASPALKASDIIEYGDINKPEWLEYYTTNSPIRQAENIDVPVLYSHGVNDPRIDISETETMVRILRKNGIHAPFIRFKDEGHGWRKLKNKLFYYRKETAFFEEILK